jgi:zinc transport system ATP-binding protein
MPVDHSKNIIEVHEVSFSYDGIENVLENITLEIHQGDYVGFIGPNGAGKTTLFKIMLHLLTPRSGTVKLFGQEVDDFKEWYKIGYVPQKATHFDNHFPASVREVVLMGRYVKRGLFQKTTKEDHKSVKEALEKVDMGGYRDRLIGDLSVGQQQRVFIARALVNQPEVIFLDEPTTGTDEKTQGRFYALLKRFNQEEGLTIAIVSHDIGRITQEVMHINCVDRTLTCHTSPEEYLRESQSNKILGQDVKIITYHHHK